MKTPDNAAMQTQNNLQRAFPEIGAGGFSRVDGTVSFYTRINALARPDMTVLDLGAGRGGQIHDADTPFLKNLLTLKGKVSSLHGADVDPVVEQNPFIDQAHIIVPDEPLPFANNQFDLIFADWVLEHVATPELFSREVDRILKPNGWFCARTPNRWGLTGMATRAVPSKYHARIVGKLQPGRIAEDVFPTCYKLNSHSDLDRHFPSEKFQNYSFNHNAEPPYVQRSRMAMAAVFAFFRVAPSIMGTNLFVFLQKKPVEGGS